MVGFKLRYLLLALVVLIGIVTYRLPASVVISRLPDGAIALLSPAGTVWTGSAKLLLNGQPQGTLSWQLRPAALLKLQLASDLSLTGPLLRLTGDVNVNTSQAVNATVNGTVAAALVNAVLKAYDIRINGDLAIEQLEVSAVLDAARLAEQRLDRLDGTVRWAGGPVSYTLQAGTEQVQLPALDARLALTAEQRPQAEVYAAGIAYPVLQAAVLEAGFVKVGMTRRFTALVGMPWPGREADHELVLEVEQQLF